MLVYRGHFVLVAFYNKSFIPSMYSSKQHIAYYFNINKVDKKPWIGAQSLLLPVVHRLALDLFEVFFLIFNNEKGFFYFLQFCHYFFHISLDFLSENIKNLGKFDNSMPQRLVVGTTRFYSFQI